MLRLDWNLLFTIINVIVFYLCMKKFLFGPVLAVMDKRQARIDEQLKQADQTGQQARAMKQEFETALASARTQVDDIIARGQISAKEEAAKLLERTEQEAARLLRDARATIDAERLKAVRELEAEVAELALTAAGKMVTGPQQYDLFVQETEAENESDLG